MKMKTGSVAMAVAMAMVLISLQPEVEAAPEVYCIRVIGGDAPFSDAATLVQDLRLNTGRCCQTNNICTVVSTFGNAAASICGSIPGNQFCMNCADAGNYVNEVLAQCVENNLVQGIYDADGTYSQLYYITSTSGLPG